MKLKSLFAVVILALSVSVYSEEIPSVQRQVVTLTIEQVTHLNTSPVHILDPVPGYFIATEWALALHTGRYATSPGYLALRFENSCSGCDLARWSANGVLLSSTGSPYEGAVARIYALGRVDDSVNSMGSKGVELFNANGDPTVSETYPGSELVIVIYYRLLPTYIPNLEVE